MRNNHMTVPRVLNMSKTILVVHNLVGLDLQRIQVCGLLILKNGC